MKKTYDTKIAALMSEKECKIGIMADELSKRHNSLTQKNQEVLDNLRNKHKTEETRKPERVFKKKADAAYLTVPIMNDSLRGHP